MSGTDFVVIESPYAGDVEANLGYARECMADSLRRGEYPLASHLLYTQPGVLDDDKPGERALGIRAGLGWAAFANLTVVYIDRGISRGMVEGFKNAVDAGRPIELRSLELDLSVPARAGSTNVENSLENKDACSARPPGRVVPGTTGAIAEAIRLVCGSLPAVEHGELGARRVHVTASNGAEVSHAREENELSALVSLLGHVATSRMLAR